MSTCAVTNFNNGLEVSSDSDDEDKLHIVEEEGQEAAARRKSRKKPAAKPPPAPNGDCNGVKEGCGSEADEADEDDGEEEEAEEAEGEKDALVEKILEQADTAIIYPEAPEEERGAAETGGADENGTPDALPLHICPYCSRAYKRNASLKEHIKYRHETSDDNYSCSHCSYTFTYRSQLERHMSHHRGAKAEPRSNATKTQRHSSGSGGTRKFKCNECSKAFKYKHHLKEHLRIHSGEKPYECSNCHKRFSHSGSYSSHISSKKCAPAFFPNGLHHPPLKPHQIVPSAAPVAIAPARNMDSKPLQEHIPLTQIKTEPVEEDIKPVLVNGVNRTGVSGLPPGVAMVVPTMGLMSPIGININDLQNVLGKVLANSGAQGKQGFVVQQPQQQIISLPAFVDHDGTTKIIINYSISPTAATTANTQPASTAVKNGPPTASAVPIVAAAPIPSKTEQSCASGGQEFPTDLSLSKRVKEEPLSDDDLGIVISKTESFAEMTKSTGCLLCEECPEHLEAIHLLQHRKAANCEAVDSAALDPSFADLLSEAGVMLDDPSPADDVLSVLRKALASNARPGNAELERIARKISIPAEVVRKWFGKMNRSRKKAVKRKNSPEQAQDLSIKGKTIDLEMQEEQDDEQARKECLKSKEDLTTNETPNKDVIVIHEPNNMAEPMEDSTNEDGNAAKESAKERHDDVTAVQVVKDDDKVMEDKTKEDVTTDEQAKDVTQEASKPQSTSLAPSSAKKDLQITIKTEPEDPSAADSETQPLDLSLPKPATPEPTETAEGMPPGTAKLETTPLNLACISKDQLEPRALYVTTPQSGNSNFVTATQIPTLVAIAGQGTVGCLSAINPATKQRTILIPQLTYTYGSTAGSDAAGKTVLLNGHKAIKVEKKDKAVSVQKSAPPAGGQGNDLDSKKLKLDHGVFPCDLCCKVFQKASSLLRHKYEHTGKRPHECVVCKKAFKHKHHLIEHARLHTGIKPYECDKCGKRFSHSGSYSQHMNHRYSYCKPNPFCSSSSVSASSSSSSPPAETLDHRYYAARSPSSKRAQSNGGAHTSEDDEEEDEEEDDEYEEEAMCMEDIRVVQVDEFGGQDEEESGEEMEVELGEGSDEDSEGNNNAGGKDKNAK
ncbi:zinc finger E-box-binding homeobox 1-like isoform X2 [Eucyclogobius newberryi]|uniref:zinc finger E-box-binding homeobox 1-like isoform X2 n=1 Tax=Eucyclogobius newberryi TaxID=166745 RepID=UPI003B5C5B0F